MNRKTQVEQADEYISTTIDAEEVILNLDSGTYFGVDGVGKRIWDLTASEQTVGEIQDAIHDEFDVSYSRVEQDVQEFLIELESATLVTTRDTE